MTERSAETPSYSTLASKLAEYAAFRVFTGMMAPDFTLADLIRDMQASEPYQQIAAMEDRYDDGWRAAEEHWCSHEIEHRRMERIATLEAALRMYLEGHRQGRSWWPKPPDPKPPCHCALCLRARAALEPAPAGEGADGG